MATAIQCLSCGESNPGGARFCNACGRRMLSRGALAAESLSPPEEADAEQPHPLPAKPSRSAHPGPRLLWWDIPADSLLQGPSFRALMTMRVATETAISALTYGMLIVIVTQHGDSRWTGLLAALVTVSTVAPAALFGPLGGVVVDRMPHRLMLVAANLVRALLCFGFLFLGTGTMAVYVLLICITAATQFATPAESAVLPRVVAQDRLAAANSFSNLSESAGQMLGMAILAPILVKLPGAPESLIIASGLLLTYAALRAVGVRFSVPPPPPQIRPAPAVAQTSKPWLAGTREALLEAWQWLAGDRAAFISMMLLVLASTANLVMVTLAPKFTREVIGLSPEFAVFVFGPAVLGMLTGLAVVPKLARVVQKRLLVTIGFLLMVTTLLLFGMLNAVTELGQRLDPLKLYSGLLSWGPLGHADGRLGTALILAVPLGFAFSLVQVAAQTLLHERVPLEMQGRVFALQGAVKNATAILPLLVLGGLASLIGDVRPVMVISALLILFLALYGGARSAQWTERMSAASRSRHAQDGAGGQEPAHP